MPEMGLEPFDPKKHTPQDVGLGGLSTEVTITGDSPDGRVWNIPSLWWTSEGKPLLIKDPKEAGALAREYEQKTGKKFPRFKSIPLAEKAAVGRSRKGGATQRPLAFP